MEVGWNFPNITVENGVDRLDGDPNKGVGTEREGKRMAF